MAHAVEVMLLGGFAVRVDGAPIDPLHWRRRQAASVVKLLALAPGHRVHREQAIDALWPDLTVAEATPRLHKTLHFARRAFATPDAIVADRDVIELFPGADVSIDVDAFEAAARAALKPGAPADAVDRALALHRGPLLPDDVYEPWTEDRRDHVRHLELQLLRTAGRWSDVLAVDPTDEGAHVALARELASRGDTAAARAQLARLERVLDDELGVELGVEARQLREQLATAGAAPSQEIRFCYASDGVRLAYAVVGTGRTLVKAATWLTHLEYDWDSLLWRHWLRGLSARYRLVRYDERGCGLSDWSTTAFTMQAWVDDLDAVVDAVGIDRFPLLGISQGAAVAVEYAARHPDRVSALVLYGGYVHGPVLRATTDEGRRAAELLPDLAALGWGSEDPAFRQVFTARFMPGGTREQWDEFNELQRRTTSPANAARFMRGFGHIDVSEAAAAVRCPTLVIHVRGDRLPPLEEGRLLASLIPGSRFLSLEGRNHLMLPDDPAWPRFLDELDRFMAGIA